MRDFRRIVTVLVVGASVLLPAGPLWADGGIGGVECTQFPNSAGCDVSAGTGGQSGEGGTDGSSGNGSGSGSDSNCRYVRVEPQAPPPAGAGPGAWYVRECDGSQTQAMWLTAAQAGDPDSLAREAVSRLRLPAPAIRANPDPAADLLVRVPVWLWVDSLTWGPRSATASVPGMSVTATATPTEVAWSFGDGSSDQTCSGAGTPWRPGIDPRAESPTCGHTYLVSSAGAPGDVFTLRATVTWSVSWVGGGQSGSVPALTTTSAVPVRVAQSQAINGRPV